MKKINNAISAIALISVLGLTNASCQKKDLPTTVQSVSDEVSIETLKESLAFEMRAKLEDIQYDEVKREFLVFGKYLYTMEEVLKKHQHVLLVKSRK